MTSPTPTTTLRRRHDMTALELGLAIIEARAEGARWKVLSRRYGYSLTRLWQLSEIARNYIHEQNTS
jgi:hypothetical protein